MGRSRRGTRRVGEARAPNPMPGPEPEIEIRQVFEADDAGAEFTPKLREQEERIRRQVEKRK